MDLTTTLTNPAERRKQVRLRVRPDLQISEQKYEGKTYHVVKDPVCLRYYRFNRQEYFVFSLFDGVHTMEQVRDRFEDEYRPQRLEHHDLESFARQLVTAGLVQNEQPGSGKHLFTRRAKQRRLRRFAAVTNILYLKIPVFDPDRLLNFLYRYLWWVFTTPFFVVSVLFMLSAAIHVALHFDTFYEKLPAYQEFFSFNSVLYMWLSLGVVKVIHEFGHGLSCKAFKGECHEMGVLLMCLSPALYANVTDAWTLAAKWKRIIISFAGIYVELCIAATATYVWWYSTAYPVVNNVALAVMVLCSVSTVVFNANPLMRFDGYYMLADWLEIPNLREKATRYLNNIFLEQCLGVETPPEPYMAPMRKVLFVSYAVGSWVYRWVVMFGVLWFLADFLGPQLKILSQMLAVVSLASMFVWPGYKVCKNIYQRGRLPDMKAARVYITMTILLAFILAFFLVPLPVSRVHEVALVTLDPAYAEAVMLPEPGRLTGLDVIPGQAVVKNQVLARFESKPLEFKRETVMHDEEYQRSIRDLQERVINNARGVVEDEALRTFRSDYREAKSNATAALEQLKVIQGQLDRVRELRAPRDGVVVTIPTREEIGKLYDRGSPDAPPVIQVGDPTHLILKVPISPQDYRVLKDDLDYKVQSKEPEELETSVYVKGRSDKVFTGYLRRLPGQNTTSPPIQLTQRGGGPLAVKSSDDPNSLIPLAQTYIVEVEMTDPKSTVRPGQMAVVKIHARWRSGAWWVGRALANALDFGLYQ